MASPTKLARDNTMEATAKEGIEFLEKANPDLAQECKTAVKEAAENGAGDVKVAKNGDSPTKLARDNTMVVTAEEGKEFVEKQGGVNEAAKTRAQEAELNSEKENDEKSATKRPAEGETEQEVDDAKKPKTSSNGEEEAKSESNGDNENKEAPEQVAAAE